MIRPGKLDRTITVLRSVEDLDVYGVPVPYWSSVALLRAELVEQSLADVKADAGSLSNRVIVLRCRWAAITLDDRLEFEGQTFAPVSLVEIGRRRGLEIKAIARGAS
ncbi:head-tail adaptor protein [Alsobacter sp. R-9]